jgi:endonuclease/exonuclease/phosphatase family metal-dependent hydrolase
VRKHFLSGIGLAVILLLLPECPPQHTLTVNVIGQGTVALDPTGGTYSQGKTVALNATPASGWHFETWQGAASGTISWAYIVMDADKLVTAVFEENPTTTNGDSVRMVTFNTRLLPEFLDDFCCVEDNEWRAERYAEAIKKAGYDIVVLNEAFDEDARDALVEQLKYEFPSYVEKIDYAGDFPFPDLEDSGLMMFSRFPFEPLPSDAYIGSQNPLFGKVTASNLGNDWGDQVATVVYEESECCSYDCRSAKGAALVRVRNTATGRPLNIAFTHTQASYGDGDCQCEVDARESQLKKIKDMILGSLGNDFDTQDTFLFGDLNIDGDQANLDYDYSHNDGYEAGNACTSHCLWEWMVRFGSPGAFFHDQMVDSWAFLQSPKQGGLYDWNFDRGRTQGLPLATERLDYVLWHAGERTAIQHLTREEPLRQTSGYWLSDHVGICADFNLWSEYCNPLEARVPAMNTLIPGNIAHPGSMQWFRIDEKGTYLFATVGAGIQYDVYEQLDLTTPASSYYDETGDIKIPGAVPITLEGARYCLPEPPFYIRVYHQDRQQTAQYKFAAHKANGASMDDAIALLPSDDWYEYVMPAWTAINEDDVVWFEFHIEKTTTGQLQHLRFRVVGDYSLDNADIQVRAMDGTTVLNEATVVEPDPDAPSEMPNRKRLIIERTDDGLEEGRYYLCVERQQVEPLGFFIGWDTDLTVLHGQGVPGAGPFMMFCNQETDAGIDDLDEIYMWVEADGVAIIPFENRVYMGQFDDDYPATFEGIIPIIRFVSNVKLTLRDSELGEPWYGGPDYFDYSIGALPRNQREAFYQSMSAVDEDEAGEYTISYNLSRTLLKEP